MKLKLKHPISIGEKGSKIDELIFRDHATAGDLLAFDERGPNKQTIALIANLSGTDEEIIKRLHVVDFRAADKITADMIKPEDTEKNAQES
jgi:hypothetical protein